jgi:glycosyltransferase involved in cell wall biosynthesis
MLKDILPQGAVDLGLINKRGIIYKVLRRKEENLYKLSDHIGCMSQANIDYLLKHNKYLKKEKIELFPNTIKVLPQKPKPINYVARKKLRLPIDKTIFVFGGNLGIPQGLEFLIDCIADLQNYYEAFFLIVGDGTERKNIEAKIKRLKLENVLLLQRLPKDDYDNLILECDVGLVSLDKRFTVPNYPSRTLAYMDMALPILAVTDKASDIKELLNEAQCGLWAYSGEKIGFTEQVKNLCENKELCIQMGKNGRRYLEEKFDVSRSVKILEDHFGK